MIWHPTAPEPGDPKLAALMRRLKPPVPMERIVRSELLDSALNREKLKPFHRIVTLACGHRAETRALNRCRCHECHRMIMAGEDYEAYRRKRR